jgi:hypothetical protein
VSRQEANNCTHFIAEVPLLADLYLQILFFEFLQHFATLAAMRGG